MTASRTIVCAAIATGFAVMLPATGAGAAVLSLDFNELDSLAGTVVTASGFESFTIDTANAVVTTPVVRSYGSFTVTLAPSNPAIGFDDRTRATPVNDGVFTQAELLTDFVFSRATGADTDGLDLTIAGLDPLAPYRFTIWSFDSGSASTPTGGRVSDWFANGVEVVSNYSFNGSVLPTSDSQYQFSFISTTDASGTMLIGGRRDAASVDVGNLASFGVFLNAVQVEAVPEPGCVGLLGIGAMGLGMVRRRVKG